MKKDYLWIDTETTNTNPKTGAIIEIGAICNGDEFHSLVKPHQGAIVSQEALDINGLTMSQLNNAPDHKSVVDQLCEFMEKSVNRYDKTDKLVMAGFNIKFDDDFLRAMFKRSGNSFLGAYRWPTLYDVQTKAIEYLQIERGNMADFKLETVAIQMGIDITKLKLHTALDDIKLTSEIDRLICLG